MTGVHNEVYQWLNAYRKAIDVNIISSITDNNGEIIYVNQKFCDISKFSEEELIGKSHNIINSDYHSKEFFNELWKTISEGKVWNGEIKNKAKDGEFYWVDTVIIPVKLQDEIQFLSLRMDITEKKELQKKQEEYLNSIEELLNFTSHKVRSPLVSIMGLMQLKKENLSHKDLLKIFDSLKLSSEEYDDFTRILTRNLHKLKEIIK